MRVTVPRIFAQEARRFGDPTVSPRDYYCGCAPDCYDWLPICEERNPGCRYAERPPPRDLTEEEIEAAHANYDRRMRRALKNYVGPKGPRGPDARAAGQTPAQNA